VPKVCGSRMLYRISKERFVLFYPAVFFFFDIPHIGTVCVFCRHPQGRPPPRIANGFVFGFFLWGLRPTLPQVSEHKWPRTAGRGREMSQGGRGRFGEFPRLPRLLGEKRGNAARLFVPSCNTGVGVGGGGVGGWGGGGGCEGAGGGVGPGAGGRGPSGGGGGGLGRGGGGRGGSGVGGRGRRRGEGGGPGGGFGGGEGGVGGGGGCRGGGRGWWG